MSAQKHLDLLGHYAEDRVTGAKGVVTSISFDLFGCIQALVHPGLDKDGKLQDRLWFDVCRLSVSEKTAMEAPRFDTGPVSEGLKGAAEKPRCDKP
jgi:hypothetical protein